MPLTTWSEEHLAEMATQFRASRTGEGVDIVGQAACPEPRCGGVVAAHDGWPAHWVSNGGRSRWIGMVWCRQCLRRARVLWVEGEEAPSLQPVPPPAPAP